MNLTDEVMATQFFGGNCMVETVDAYGSSTYEQQRSYSAYLLFYDRVETQETAASALPRSKYFRPFCSFCSMCSLVEEGSLGSEEKDVPFETLDVEDVEVGPTIMDTEETVVVVEPPRLDDMEIDAVVVTHDDAQGQASAAPEGGDVVGTTLKPMDTASAAKPDLVTRGSTERQLMEKMDKLAKVSDPV